MVEQEPGNCLAGWYFTRAEIESALSNKQMLNPSIDLSNICDLNCHYCFIEGKNSSQKVRTPGELTFQDKLRVIDDFYLSGAKTINIVGAGEPTLDPDFEKITDYIAGKNMKTVLFTNGIRFYRQPELIDFLCDREVSIVLKYNSTSNEIQDLVTGRNGYSRIRNRVLEYLMDTDLNTYEPTRLGLDLIVFNGNVKDIPKIYDWCRKNNVYPIAAEYIPSGRTEGGVFQDNESLINFQEWQKKRVRELLQPITQVQRTGLLIKLQFIDNCCGIKRTPRFAHFCGDICSQILGMYVDIEGNIWPCVAKKKKIGHEFVNGYMGNIRRGDLPSEKWRNHEYMEIIRKSFNGCCPYKPGLHLN
jgi:MoaA/NifB/PqqE/SkfB family radical SAM enzyme